MMYLLCGTSFYMLIFHLYIFFGELFKVFGQKLFVLYCQALRVIYIFK